jgi:hypothetical protein
MSATIIRGSEIELVYVGTPTGTVDLSCYAFAFELTPSVEEIDVGTFCVPSATETGRVTYTALIALLWEPALYTLLQPHVRQQGVLHYKPSPVADPTNGLSFNTRFASQPWGRFELGQRIEVELPLAVLSDPVWGPIAALELEPETAPEGEGTEAPAVEEKAA